MADVTPADATNDPAEWVRAIVGEVERALVARRDGPAATYRLQFDPRQLTFRDAAALVPYLDDLGVSHVYASPYLRNRSDCPHGYAVVDYGQLNPALGNEADYEAMVEALRARGMGQVLDIVPNHMAASPDENAWWRDVLENGPSSPYAEFFDIDWRPVKEELRGKVLLPVLGGQFGQVLESGELSVEYDQGAFVLRYYDTSLPLDPRTYGAILTDRLDELKGAMPSDSEDVMELESIATALEYLPERHETQPERVEERQREKEVVKHRLRRLVERCPEIAAHVEENLRRLHGTPGRPQTFDALEHLIEAQVYRLSHWKAAADEINYRRFFDINELAAVCMEEPRVFDKTHEMVFRLLVEGRIDGVRVDHIDGLYDPREYLWRLQWGLLRATARAAHARLLEARGAAAATDSELPAWEQLEAGVLGALWRQRGGVAPEKVFPHLVPPDHDAPPAELSGETAPAAAPAQVPLYVLVEKILGPEEPLPPEWPCAGTTGYDFMNQVHGLFVDPAGLGEMGRFYRRFAGQVKDFREVAYQSKLLIMRAAMSSELQLLAHRLNRISEHHRLSRDFTLNTLRNVLREILACFPVYRTYIGREGASARDRQVVVRAVAQAKRRNPAVDAAAFNFALGVLLLEQPPELDEAGRRERELFVGRFQQVTSPVTAKGVEDTAFYRYYPLASANEVGGEPLRAAVSIEEFHAENLARRAAWPRSMVSTSTHDTKRSEDVRARIAVLSEIPQLWRKAVNRWTALNRRRHRKVEGQTAPSRNDEHLFYQTLVGVWPIEPLDPSGHQDLVRRMVAYMEKATREAKVHTSWISPEDEYDEAVRRFVESALGDEPGNRFLADFRQFHEKVVHWGLYTALSQVLLKMISPGVPDVYQGQELWDFSLVDPDNRRPIDFARRREWLSELSRRAESGERGLAELAGELASRPNDPRLKLLVTWKSLHFRRSHEALFRRGRYVPLAVEGDRARHVCAFAWHLPPEPDCGEQVAIAVAPRWLARLVPLGEDGSPPGPPTGPDVWGDTRLAPAAPGETAALRAGPLHNVFTGRECAIDDPPSIALAAALADFPVALLVNDQPGSPVGGHRRTP